MRLYVMECRDAVGASCRILGELDLTPPTPTELHRQKQLLLGAAAADAADGVAASGAAADKYTSSSSSSSSSSFVLRLLLCITGAELVEKETDMAKE